MGTNKLSYEDYCRILGELYLTAHKEMEDAKLLIARLTKENAGLREEIRRIDNKYSCEVPNENS